MPLNHFGMKVFFWTTSKFKMSTLFLCGINHTEGFCMNSVLIIYSCFCFIFDLTNNLYFGHIDSVTATNCDYMQIDNDIVVWHQSECYRYTALWAIMIIYILNKKVVWEWSLEKPHFWSLYGYKMCLMTKSSVNLDIDC